MLEGDLSSNERIFTRYPDAYQIADEHSADLGRYLACLLVEEALNNKARQEQSFVRYLVMPPSFVKWCTSYLDLPDTVAYPAGLLFSYIVDKKGDIKKKDDTAYITFEGMVNTISLKPQTILDVHNSLGSVHTRRSHYKQFIRQTKSILNDSLFVEQINAQLPTHPSSSLITMRNRNKSTGNPAEVVHLFRTYSVALIPRDKAMFFDILYISDAIAKGQEGKLAYVITQIFDELKR